MYEKKHALKFFSLGYLFQNLFQKDMKKYIIASGIFMLMGSFIYQAKSDDKTFKQLQALEGKWIMKTKKGFMGEEWVKVNEGNLQGKGFFVKGSDTVITERVSLKNTKEGIFYASSVEDQNNNQPIPFRLTSSEKKVFVFENPEHDFPKRIVYELVSSDSLHAYIDGGVAATEKRQHFYYHKVN